MNLNNKALINYYARLIQKGNYEMEKVPEGLRPIVEETLKTLKPLEEPEEIVSDDTNK